MIASLSEEQERTGILCEPACSSARSKEGRIVGRLDPTEDKGKAT